MRLVPTSVDLSLPHFYQQTQFSPVRNMALFLIILFQIVTEDYPRITAVGLLLLAVSVLQKWACICQPALSQKSIFHINSDVKDHHTGSVTNVFSWSPVFPVSSPSLPLKIVPPIGKKGRLNNEYMSLVLPLCVCIHDEHLAALCAHVLKFQSALVI